MLGSRPCRPALRRICLGQVDPYGSGRACNARAYADSVRFRDCHHGRCREDYTTSKRWSLRGPVSSHSCCRLLLYSSACGNGSRVEREVASLEIRVRFPVAAPAECHGDYIGKTERSIGFNPRNGRASDRWSPFFLVGHARAANVVGTTCREFESRRSRPRWGVVVAQR